MAPADMMNVGADGHSIICLSEQPAKSAPAHAPKSTDHKTADCVVCQAQQLFSAALTPEPVAFVSPLIHSNRPVLSVSHDLVVTAVAYRAQQPRAPPAIA